MNLENIIIVLIAFAFYLLLMIFVGAYYSSRTKSNADYFLGNRGLNGWVAALSAQASDMSGWLLMGLPGAIYLSGTGQIWIAVGLFIGTVLNWLFIASRLRRYTIRANNSLTLPQYFKNRFHDDSNRLLAISSVIIVIFFLVYTAASLAAGGKLFFTIFGIDYRTALTIGMAVILIYTILGGFLAVCVTDFIQGMLMLVALMAVPLVIWGMISGKMTNLLTQSGVDAAAFCNPMMSDGKPLSFLEILSQLAWGLGYCGMPHILVRFMAIRDEKELTSAKGIGIIWCALSLGFACLIGVLGRAYLMPMILGAKGAASAENVFIEMILKLFTNDMYLPFVAGIFLCGILAAIMSTADSQLLVTASAVSEDFYKGVIRKGEGDGKRVLRISKLSVLVIAVLAYLIALDPDSSVMNLVSDAWAGFGSAFGPVVLLSLYWKRINLPGAATGMAVGALTVIVWDYLPIIGGQTPAAATGVYSLLVGFFLALLAIICVSLLTKAPDAKMLQEFEDATGK